MLGHEELESCYGGSFLREGLLNTPFLLGNHLTYPGAARFPAWVLPFERDGLFWVDNVGAWAVLLKVIAGSWLLGCRATTLAACRRSVASVARWQASGDHTCKRIPPPLHRYMPVGVCRQATDRPLFCKLWFPKALFEISDHAEGTKLEPLLFETTFCKPLDRGATPLKSSQREFSEIVRSHIPHGEESAETVLRIVVPLCVAPLQDCQCESRGEGRSGP